MADEYGRRMTTPPDFGAQPTPRGLFRQTSVRRLREKQITATHRNEDPPQTIQNLTEELRQALQGRDMLQGKYKTMKQAYQVIKGALQESVANSKHLEQELVVAKSQAKQSENAQAEIARVGSFSVYRHHCYVGHSLTPFFDHHI